MDNTVCTQKKRPISKNRFKTMDLFVVMCGLSAPIGEKMNVYFPLFSKLYVICGMILSLFYFTNQMLNTGNTYSRKENRIGILYVFFGIFVFIHSLVTYILYLNTYMEKEFFSVFKTVIFIFIAYILFKVFRDNRRRIKNFLIAFNGSFSILFLFFNTFIFANTVSRAEGVYEDANAFAFDAVFVIFASMYLLNENKKGKLLNIITLFVGIVALFLSGSRGAFIGVLVGLMVYFVTLKGMNKKLKAISLIGLIAIIIVFLTPKKYLVNMINRYLHGDSDESGYLNNVRLQIWVYYLIAIEEYFWVGLDTELWNLINRRITHNNYLYVFVKYGFIAFMAYMGMVISNIKFGILSVNKRSQADKIIFALVIAYLVACLFIDTLNFKTTWVVWILFLKFNNLYKAEMIERT